MRSRVWFTLAAMACAVGLVACAHTVTIIPLDGSPPGHGSAEGKGWGNSGVITVELAGRHYVGEWIYVENGGSIGYSTATAFSGAHTATAFGTVFNAPMSGNGQAHMRSDDGHVLNCGFNYSQWSATGIGQCADADGKLYDLHIKN